MKEFITRFRNSKLFQLYNSFSCDFKDKNIDAYSASSAFFVILSIVPMLMVICSIVPYTPVTEEELISLLVSILPSVFHSLVERLVSEAYASSGGVLTISIVVTIWISGKGMRALQQGLNRVNGVEDRRNYFLKQTVGSFYSVIFAIGLILSFVLIVFGQMIVSELENNLTHFGVFWSLIRWPRYVYLFLILTLIFSLFFCYMPNKKLKFREQIPGAMFSSLCWIGYSYAFSFYVMYGNLSVYGSMVMISLVMLWCYFCINILLIGAFLNSYFRPINRVLVYSTKYRKRNKYSEAADEVIGLIQKGDSGTE